MLHHIKKLHTHPEHVRERIALGVASVVTLFILIAWVTTLPVRLASYGEGAGDNQAAAGQSLGGLTVVNEKQEPNSPTAIFRGKTKEAYEGFLEAVGY